MTSRPSWRCAKLPLENITLEMLEEPEEPVQQPVSELDMPSDFRAPQLGLGD